MRNGQTKQIVVLHSGGLDSTVLLWMAVDRYGVDGVLSFGVDYGQRHRVELDAAAEICSANGIDRIVVDLHDLGQHLTGSSQTDARVDVPHGHYADESMKLTVVPNRNMVLIACAGALALARRASRIGYAAHTGDHTIYPDCRPSFANAIDEALALADWSPVRLWRPLIDKSKADIVRIGDALGAPLEKTWSCYEGDGRVHCARCGTCAERREAFKLAGIDDPTEYVTP